MTTSTFNRLGKRLALSVSSVSSIEGDILGVSSVAVLILTGVLSNSVSAQTVIVPRVPRVAAAIPVAAGSASLPSGAPNASGSNLAAGSTAQNPVYAPTVTAGQFSPYVVNPATNTATITETSNAGILAWNSFDIGVGGTVNIVQPSSTSILLNRVNGSVSQSLINGALNANGTVYLYNPNGFIFGKTAVVNVGSLFASSLNVTDSLFLQGILSSVDANFKNAAGATSTPGNILIDGDSSSQAQLNAAVGGKIVVFAPNVTNNGVVTAPDGQVILAGGGEVFLAAPTDPSMRGLFVAVNSGTGILPTGTSTSVTNNGSIAVGRGNATLVGLAVNQNGQISAQTSANINGSIYLLAQDGATRSGNGKADAAIAGTLTLGSGSTTAVSILDDGSTITPSANNLFKPSQIQLLGQTINLQGKSGSQPGAQVLAPGGVVTVLANANPGAPIFVTQDASAVTLGAGSLIDVSGDTSAVLPMSSNVVSVQLLAELADNLPLRNSSLRGQTLNFDIRKGTTIANISADLAILPFTIGQLAATGGSVTVNSNGTLAQDAGSSINVSGGRVNFSAGYVNTSFLTSGGALFSDSSAPSNRLYSGVVNRPDGRWDYQPAYFDGKSAGTIALAAPEMALQGSLSGTVTPGLYQRDISASNRPLGGQLMIGVTPGGGLNDTSLPLQFGFAGNLVLDNNTTMPATTDTATVLASNLLDLNVDSLAANGFTRLSAYSGGNITVAGPLSLAAGGSLSLTALGNINFNAGATIPGGTVSATAPLEIAVASNARFDLAGTWRNDAKLANPTLNINGVPTGDIVLNGGSFALDSNQIALGNNVTVDVSGGAWYANTNKLTTGNAGSIKILIDPNINTTTPTDIISVGSGLTLNGYGFGKGGSLTLATNNIQIGGSAAFGTDPLGLTLMLPANFFGSGGFTSYNLDSLFSVDVIAGATVNAIAQNWVFNDPGKFKTQGSGSVASVAAPGMLTLAGPQSGRQPVNITLAATGAGVTGSVLFGAGSLLQTDPLGSLTVVANQLIDVEGTISVPAGQIALSLSGTGYDPLRSIWVGAAGHLFAQGSTALLYTNGSGSTTGAVLGGGTINLGGVTSLSKGAGDIGEIVIEQQSLAGQQGGASIDVSGIASAPLILAGQRIKSAAAPIASAGGTVTILAREGVVFDGTVSAAAGNSTQQGGSLSLSLSRETGIAATGFPDQTPDVLNIIDGPIVPQLPSGIAPGSDLSALANQASINTASFNKGGFDQLSFKSQNTINISSVTSSAVLSAKTAVYLDSTVLAFGNGANAAIPLTDVQINSAYVQLGNDDFLTQAQPTANVTSNINNNLIGKAGTFLSASPALGGAATLNVNATTIDLIGSSVVQGVQNTNLNATQDIRLVGISQKDLTVGPTPNVVTPLEQLIPTGEFSVAGNLTLNSAQVYPTTLTNFALDVQGVNGTLNFVSNGNKPYAPLSAAGTLFAFAQNINQAGVVAAPFGTIDFVAGSQLTYAKGSLTTVAGVGVVPFGEIINGRDWVYDFGNGNDVLFQLPTSTNVSVYPVTALPQKVVIASAPNITTEAGATINLAGGGQLYGYEFTPGSYGSADVLKNNIAGAQTNVFAILPGYANAVAPRDYQYGQDGGLQPGQSVYLSGIAGLAAGNYVLLPAHYALLPGAFAVTLSNSGHDAVAAQNVVNLNGSYSVAGSTNYQGNGDTRNYAFTVTPGSVVRQESQYQEYSASSFFAAAAKTASVALPVLPIDGGHLEFNASNSLTLDGQFELQADNGGVNGIVDISAPAIEVVSVASQAVPTGTLELVASNLNSLSASSLLLGGVRTINGGTSNIAVGAQSVTIANNASNALSGSEIILAAQQNLTLAQGASVQASGAALTTNQNLAILATDPNGLAVGTDGALLRVSTGGAVAVSRTSLPVTVNGVVITSGVAPSGQQGVLTIQSGATIAATGSAYIDSTDIAAPTVNQGNLNLAAGAALGLSAPRISLGDAIPVGASGLQLNTAALSGLDTLSALTLNSYSTIDIYGHANLGSAAMNVLTLSAGGIQGNYLAGAAGDVNLTAQSVQLSGGALTPVGAVAAGSAGSLNISAAGITVGNAGNFKISGYGNVNLTTPGVLNGVGNGGLSVDSNLNLTAGMITAGAGSHITYGAGQNLVLAEAGNPTVAAPALQAGGNIAFNAATVVSNANIDLPSGTVSINAGNGVSLTGGTISTAGLIRSFGTTTAYTPGGTISIIGGSGNVTVAAGNTLDVSAVGASAGQLTVAAAGSASSTVVLNGVLKGSATPGVDGNNQTQGSFSLDAGQLVSANQFDQLASTLTMSGFNAAQTYRVRNGDVNLDTGNTLRARQVSVSADNGSVNIGGIIDASGPAGGAIALFAAQPTAGGQSGNVNLLAGSLLNASASAAASSTTVSTAGSTGTGGSVMIGTGSTDAQMATGFVAGSVINFASGALIDVHGNSQELNGDANGTVTFRAPQIVGGNDVAIAGLNGTINGSKLTTVEGYKAYSASSITASAASATNLQVALPTSGAVASNSLLYLDASQFGNGGAAAALFGRSNSAIAFNLSPGIQVTSQGDLTVSVNEGLAVAAQNRGWNLDAWRFNGQPVNLTLLAAGNLFINGSISDGFIKSSANIAMPGWNLDSTNSGNFTLVGGADLSAANPLAVNHTNTGDVQLNFVNTTGTGVNTPVALIRTGTGTINIAAGQDVVMGQVANVSNPALTLGAVIYTAGKSTAYDGSLGSFTAPSSTINTQFAKAATKISAQFAEDGGAVSIVAQNNVIGAPEQQVVDNWLFRQGTLAVDSKGNPIVDSNGNPTFAKSGATVLNTAWWARPDYFDQGIATLGGGNVSVVAVSGTIADVSASTATSAFLPGSGPTGALVQRGGGDLLVRAGGDIAGGSFYVQKGSATITAGGSVTSGSIVPTAAGAPGPNVNTVLALGDAQLSVTANNNISIDAIYNPTLTAQSTYNSGLSMNASNPFSGVAKTRLQYTTFSTYTNQSEVSLTAIGGDVALNNNSVATLPATSLGANAIPILGLDQTSHGNDFLYSYLPATFNVLAMSGNINSVGGFTMAGAPTGELNLLANGSISLSGLERDAVVMADISQSQFPQVYAPRNLVLNDAQDLGVLDGFGTGIAMHSATGLHNGDTQPVRIIALNGNIVGDPIQNDTLILPKLAEISAAHDILNLGFKLQQNSVGDVTTITAGNNITDVSNTQSNGSLLNNTIGGPGRIDISAGHTIDLGDTVGLVTRGNLDNTYLTPGGAGINLTAGTTTANYAGFATNYLTAASLNNADQATLISYINVLSPGSVSTAGDAWSALQKLPVAQQQQFLGTIKPDLNALYFTDLVSASKIKGLVKFDNLVATLFPTVNPNGGDINVFASQLKTQQGGAIYMFTPAGSVYAGLPNQPVFLTQKLPSNEGIFTIGGGAIAALVHDNFEVDQGRVFTLDGGDISLVSQFGNLSAGKGTKTASSAPPPLLRTDAAGNTIVDISSSISGSGIGTLEAFPNAPAANIYVVAPRGTFDAGDAGVRSTGSVTINAAVVLNAGNIVAAGAVSGVPSVESLSVGAGLSSNVTPSTNDLTKNIANAASNGNDATNLSVDVLGYGGDATDETTSDDSDEKKKKRKKN